MNFASQPWCAGARVALFWGLFLLWRGPAAAVLVADASFPDFSLEELKLRSSHITCPHILALRFGWSGQGGGGGAVRAEAAWRGATGAFGKFARGVIDRLPVAKFADWGTKPTTSLPGALRQYAWRVPEQVMQLIPTPIQELIGCSGNAPLVVLRNLQFLDICAGRARIARIASAAGLCGVAIDREYSVHMDLNTCAGFALAVLLLLRTQPGGLLFLAAQCSSWVWVARSHTGRSKANPRGHETKPVVAEGNSLNDRAAHLCYIASMLQVVWVIEQPASSLFFDTDRMSSVIKYCGATRVHLWLYDYGHSARKGTVFVGTAAWLPVFARSGKVHEDAKQVATTKPRNEGDGSAKGKREARTRRAGQSMAKAMSKAGGKASCKRPKPTPLCAVTTTRAGKRQVNGKRACLKASQVYPAKLAIAIVRARFPGAFAAVADNVAHSRWRGEH